MALLFILFSKNSGSILLPESGESLFQVWVWKNHLHYCLLFGEIGASPLLLYVCFCMCMCVQVWVSCGLWMRGAINFQTVKGFTDTVTFSSQSMKTSVPLCKPSQCEKSLIFTLWISLSFFFYLCTLTCITASQPLLHLCQPILIERSNLSALVVILMAISLVLHPVVGDLPAGSLSDKNKHQ